MKLPNGNAAIMSPEKVRDYLLSAAHPIGRYKFTFFRSLGYQQDRWETLDRDIRALIAGDAKPLELTEYGKKYAIHGSVTGPNGRSARIVSIWIILNAENVPRFITAYPED